MRRRELRRLQCAAIRDDVRDDQHQAPLGSTAVLSCAVPRSNYRAGAAANRDRHRARDMQFDWLKLQHEVIHHGECASLHALRFAKCSRPPQEIRAVSHLCAVDLLRSRDDCAAQADQCSSTSDASMLAPSPEIRHGPPASARPALLVATVQQGELHGTPERCKPRMTARPPAKDACKH